MTLYNKYELWNSSCWIHLKFLVHVRNIYIYIYIYIYVCVCVCVCEFKIWGVLFGKICTLKYNSSVIILSKKSGWFNTSLHDYKQISPPKVHTINWSARSSHINRKVYIYMRACVRAWTFWPNDCSKCVIIFKKCSTLLLSIADLEPKTIYMRVCEWVSVCVCVCVCVFVHALYVDCSKKLKRL